MGGRIEYARKRARLTQAALGEILGVSARTIYNYEANVSPFPAAHVTTLEYLAKIPKGWILYDGQMEEGSATPGFIIAFVTAVVLFLMPPSTESSVSCHCAVTFDARQPRTKLAKGRRRRFPGKGRLLWQASPRQPTRRVQ